MATSKTKDAAEKPAAKAEAKTKAAPKAAAVAKKSEKPVTAAPKAAPKKEVASGKVKVTQIGSKIARRHDQEATLIGLGLNKLNRSRVLEDTPSVRGMIQKVHHLVTVEKVS